VGGIALAYAAMGNLSQASEGMRKLEAALSTDALERAMNLLILIHTTLGQFNEAIRLIDKGIEYRLPMMVYLTVEPMLRPLHGMPEFEALVKKIF
jgi:adenylate cyclase